MLVRRIGEDWHEPEVREYPNEAELQRMVAESPTLLPGVDGPVAVAREFGCSYGRIDVVTVDVSGQIIVCECKTARNQELRRKVVGQIFAYAAALWDLSWEEFARSFEKATGAALVDQVRALASEEDWDEESFRDEVARRLKAGEFRLVLAVEAIPEELQEIVRFLNVHSASRLEVLALELSYRRDGEVEILVPHTWGEESVKPPGGKGALDQQTLVANTRRNHSPAAADAAEAILDWAERDPRIEARYTRTSGVIQTAGGLTLLKLRPKRSITKGLEVSLHRLAGHGEGWDDERIEQFIQELSEIGVNLEGDRRWPKASLEPLANTDRCQRFFESMEDAIKALTGRPASSQPQGERRGSTPDTLDHLTARRRCPRASPQPQP